MKKKKNDTFKNVADSLSSFDFESAIVDLLFMENKINYKKKHNLKLSKEENIFDLYFVRPSLLLRILNNKAGDK